MRTEQEFFAFRFSLGPYAGSGKFHGFYYHEKIARMNGGGKTPIKVKVVADEAGDYFTWWDAEKDDFHFTAYAKGLVDMCFPYGSRVEEEHGRGKVIRCRVEEV